MKSPLPEYSNGELLHQPMRVASKMLQDEQKSSRTLNWGYRPGEETPGGGRHDAYFSKATKPIFSRVSESGVESRAVETMTTAQSFF